MILRVHKGTEEIGGSCIELSTENTTILVDYGTPLQKGSKQVRFEKKVDGIVISHPHQDHYGEIDKIDSSVPVYCGELSRELMNATRLFTGRNLLENAFETFKAWQGFTIGDFYITPYLVDHSATDAYAFLIEADGKSILYSGDFRSNGRKSILYQKMLKNEQIKNVDILLLEGTMLKRDNEDFPDEQSVENHIHKVITSDDKISFLICSSQNIDSIVSAYRACKKARRIFVIDIYTAWILEKLRIVSDNVPNIAWPDVKVITKFGGNYYEKLKENPKYFGKFKTEVFNHIVDIHDLEQNPSRYFLKVSPWHIQKLMELLGAVDANIIYSQWLGYLTEEFSDSNTVALFGDLRDKYAWSYAHTSGHADLKSLKQFADTVKPKKLIPIHTEFKEEFEEHFANVALMSDGESYDVNSDNLTQHQVEMFNELFKEELEEGIRMNFVRKLVKSIVSNRHMPKVQVERELGPILEIFIESAMIKLGENGEIERGKYKLIGPEFPLQSQKLEKGKQTDRSTNIDYLMLNEDSDTLYFVELKTDSTSFKPEQYEIYKKIIERIEKEGSGHLYGFLKDLTIKNKKYKYYEEKVVTPNFAEEQWEDIKKAKLIYLAPKRLSRPSKHRKVENQEIINTINFIHFEDLLQYNTIDHEHSKEWELITEYLEELDEN